MRSRKRPMSVSAVRTYEGCPHRYYLAYIKREGDEREVPVHWRIGSAGHAALEATFKAYAEGGVVAPLSNLEDKARQALLTEWERLGLPTDDGLLDRAIEDLQRALDAHEEIDPASIVGVESWLEAETPGGVRVVGRADLILRAGPQSVDVRDHKWSSRAQAPEQLAADFQLAVYAWMVGEEQGASRTYASHHYPPLGRVVSVEIPPEAKEEAVDRIEVVAEMIEMDEEYAPEVSEQCSHCPFKDTLCPAWQDGSPLRSALSEVEDF